MPKRYLFVSQWGDRFYAASRKELKEQVPGKVSIMYRDKKDGSSVRCGYVIGNLWLTQYEPVERPA